jgi:hypothetical protein
VVRLFLDNSILPQAGRSSVKLSLIGNGTAPRIILVVSGEKDKRSPVTGDCHAGICGSLGGRFPQATRPLTALLRFQWSANQFQ